MKNRNGFTLLEVILTIALLGIIITISTNLFIFGNKVQNLSMTDVDIQASTRLTSEYINNVTRFATKAHTIPRSSFQNTVDGFRDPITSYIGITKEGHLVIDKPGLNTSDPRIIQMIAKKQKGIDYEIVFNQVMYDKDGNSDNGDEAKLDTLLSFSVVGKKNGKKVTEILSNIEVLNALNIDHLGTPSDPAVALAFSMVEPGNQEWIEVSPDAYITMVLDTSGSMAWDMITQDDGQGAIIPEQDKRINILKANAQKMIDRLANMDFDIYVSLVPFSNYAYNPANYSKIFYNLNVESELNTVKSNITALNVGGATNTGDGIRRAYYNLKDARDDLISLGKSYSDFTQHMMILVDGATNLETYKKDSSNWSSKPSGPLYIGKDKVGINNVNVRDPFVTTGIFFPTYHGSKNNDAYVNKIGIDLIQKTHIFEEETKQIINTFVIGFSNDSADFVSLESIGTAVKGKIFEDESGQRPYVIATNARELDFAFEQFEAEVENSLWVITRPQLKP